MPEILHTPRAREDLIDIWRYTFDEWGERQADKYLDEIESKILQLQENPELGRARNDVRADYRSLTANRHTVFYKIGSDVITIIRVLHSSRDPNRHV